MIGASISFYTVNKTITINIEDTGKLVTNLPGLIIMVIGTVLVVSSNTMNKPYIEKTVSQNDTVLLQKIINQLAGDFKHTDTQPSLKEGKVRIEHKNQNLDKKKDTSQNKDNEIGLNTDNNGYNKLNADFKAIVNNKNESNNPTKDDFLKASISIIMSNQIRTSLLNSGENSTYFTTLFNDNDFNVESLKSLLDSLNLDDMYQKYQLNNLGDLRNYVISYNMGLINQLKNHEERFTAVELALLFEKLAEKNTEFKKLFNSSGLLDIPTRTEELAKFFEDNKGKIQRLLKYIKL